MDVFRPFEEEGQLVFCTWHQDDLARTLDQAVPELGESIKGKDEWRAVVLGTGFEPSAHIDYLTRDNPFDFAMQAHTAEGATPGSPFQFTESPFPLVRLTHMLQGFPRLSPKSYAADPCFLDSDGNRVYLSDYLAQATTDDEFRMAEERFQEAAATGYDPQTQFQAQWPTPDQRRQHEELLRFYEPQQTRPTEMVALAPRIRRVDDESGDVGRAWAPEDAHRPSQFVARNNYPALCRFAVYDLEPQGHSRSDLEELCFALGALTVAVNDVPAGGLQADRLYRMDVAIDKEAAAEFWNEHLGLLVDIRQYADKGLTPTVPRLRSAQQAPAEHAKVLVDLDELKGESLRVKETGYSLAADWPASESSEWQDSTDALHRKAARFSREPPRALLQAVATTRSKMSQRLEDSEPLTPIEILELEESLTERSNGLVRRPEQVRNGPETLESIIAHHDCGIRDNMSERLDVRTISIIGAVVLGAWIAALLPYLAMATFEGGVNFGESLLVATALLGVLVLVGYLCLEVYRRTLVRMIKEFNTALRLHVAETIRSAQEDAQYLSELVAFTLGKRRLAVEQERDAQRRGNQQRLRKLRQTVEDRIEMEKSLVKSVDRAVRITPNGHALSVLDGSGLSRVERVMQWPHGLTTCEFNHSGDVIRAPYPFIERLTVEALALFEPPEVQEGT